MEQFEISVPLNIEGEGSGKSKDTKATEENTKEVKNLRQGIVESLGLSKILADVLGGLYTLLSPILKLLNILFIVIFLPLLPLIDDLTKGLAKLVDVIAKLTREGGAKAFVEEHGKGVAGILAGILLAVGGIILFLVGGWILVILGVVGAIIIAFWNEIKALFIWIGEGLKWVWESVLKPIFETLGKGISWVWNTLLKPIFEIFWAGLKLYWGLWSSIFSIIWKGLVFSWDLISMVFNWLGQMFRTIWTDIIGPVWNWIKDRFNSIVGFLGNIANALRNAYNSIKNAVSKIPIIGKAVKVDDAIIKPDGQIIQTHPKDYLFATKTPEKMFGNQGGITININNPSVRNSQDTKKIAEEVSKVLERKLWRSY
jgi:hypothetical protein